MTRRWQAALRIGLLAVAFSWPSGRAVFGEDFDEARLGAGKADYAEKRYPQAIDEFRIAAFGFLDRPAMLSECLIRLSLAQVGAGKSADADATLDRFLEVERRFAVYDKTSLEPEIRAEFRALLTRRLPEATLLGVPSLAGLVETEEQKIAKLPADQRRKALEDAAKREPSSVRWPLALARDAQGRGDAKSTERWANKALALDGGNADALALRAQARVARGECESAMKDLAGLSEAEFQKRPDLYAEKFVCAVEGKDWAVAEHVATLVPASSSGRSDVLKAQQRLSAARSRRSTPAASPSPGAGTESVARSSTPTPPSGGPQAASLRSKEVLEESQRLISAGRAGEAKVALAEALKTDPSNRALRLALLEAACLSRAYAEGAAQLPLVTPFADNEVPSMFYAAVVLYETGKKDEARGYLERAAPRVSGPLVDEYSAKILGQR